MGSHYGKDFKILLHFFGIQYVADFVRKCVTCQKQGSLTLGLLSIPVSTAAMNQIGVYICKLPEVDGYYCFVVCINYFSIWSEAKPRKDKKATTVSKLLYELLCRHGCFSIQKNVVVIFSTVSPKLHRMSYGE